MVQQIHSFRASGVMSSHAASADLLEARAFRKSAGSLCTTPPEIAFLSMALFYLDFCQREAPAALSEQGWIDAKKFLVRSSRTPFPFPKKRGLTFLIKRHRSV
jgi:hypothetical protein